MMHTGWGVGSYVAFSDNLYQAPGSTGSEEFSVSPTPRRQGELLGLPPRSFAMLHFKAQPNVLAGMMSAFVCSSPLPCSFFQAHCRRSNVWHAPASHRSPSLRAAPFIPRVEQLPALRMEINLNNQQQSLPVAGAFPVVPRAAVAVAACRFVESGNMEWLLIQRGKEPNYGEWSLPGHPFTHTMVVRHSHPLSLSHML